MDSFRFLTLRRFNKTLMTVCSFARLSIERNRIKKPALNGEKKASRCSEVLFLSVSLMWRMHKIHIVLSYAFVCAVFLLKVWCLLYVPLQVCSTPYVLRLFFSPFSALPMMSLLLFFLLFSPHSLLLPLCATHHRTPMRLHLFIPFSSSIKTALVIRKIGAALRPLSSLAIKLLLDFFPCVCVSNSDCRCDCCNDDDDDDDQSDRSLVFYFYPAFFFSKNKSKWLLYPAQYRYCSKAVTIVQTP